MKLTRQTQESDGLQEMRLLNFDYLKSGTGEEQVSKFLEKAQKDDKLLLRFLRGRKFNAKYAWETLKRNAEVRFNLYPELFPKEYSDDVRQLAYNSEIIGILKGRDKLGRRVDLFDLGAWDPEEFSADKIMTMAVKLADVKILDMDGTETGGVVIIQCSGLRVRHVREATLSTIRRVVDVLQHAYPVRVKGVFIINAPYFFAGIAKILKFLLPRKLKKRLFITSEDGVNCQELMELVSAQELPKSFGGPLDFNDAVEDIRPLFG